ncbi:hypothetical protein QQZ08_004314 [Neonectria magnoliae]|uniref:Exo-beta-D-glucosaminidase Ig-fold domain-containing protein n=1 Tax=Neonectria magnoliae TaxID=2732573 RepID=A0ABR1I6A3_9HYPO
MSTNASSFYNRKIYNEALAKRYGSPRSLDDYLLKAQIMDYEATRAQFEAYNSQWKAERPATGSIYWMLNSAWPNLHWNQFDHYLHPAGSYFGSKVGLRQEHVAYDYVRKCVWIINHSLDREGPRKIKVELIDLNGHVLGSEVTLSVRTRPNTAKNAGKLSIITKIKDVAFLRLILVDEKETVLSRNVYWLGTSVDKLDWENSTWYHTPVTEFPDLSALRKMQKAKLTLKLVKCISSNGTRVLKLENTSSVPAFFIRLHLVDEHGSDVNPVIWSDNYVTLWPKEKMLLTVSYPENKLGRVEMSGGNIKPSEISLLSGSYDS